MWIKICGLTTAKTAHYCAVSGADAIGFVFAASKRKIAVTAARQIIEGLPPALEKVGVFVNAPHQEVAEIQHYLDLDVLQFHGAESPEYCSWFHSKVIKAFRISSAQDLLAIESYRGKIWACLLDSHIIGSDGGTGKPWDWSLFKTNQANSFSGFRTIAAGGLTPQNVAQAIQLLKPDGVDTSSGVENGGRKDHFLIKQFIDTVRRCEQSELT